MDNHVQQKNCVCFSAVPSEKLIHKDYLSGIFLTVISSRLRSRKSLSRAERNDRIPGRPYFKDHRYYQQRLKDKTMPGKSMPDAYDRITLLCRLKTAQTEIKNRNPEKDMSG